MTNTINKKIIWVLALLVLLPTLTHAGAPVRYFKNDCAKIGHLGPLGTHCHELKPGKKSPALPKPKRTDPVVVTFSRGGNDNNEDKPTPLRTVTVEVVRSGHAGLAEVSYKVGNKTYFSERDAKIAVNQILGKENVDQEQSLGDYEGEETTLWSDGTVEEERLRDDEKLLPYEDKTEFKPTVTQPTPEETNIWSNLKSIVDSGLLAAINYYRSVANPPPVYSGGGGNNNSNTWSDGSSVSVGHKLGDKSGKGNDRW